MEKPPILRVLEDARLAHRAGDYTNALRFYEHFFDHALDEDASALYSLRFSHCLDGWAQLAQEFPGARQRLQQKQQQVLLAYQATKIPDRFFDYWEISARLGDTAQALQVFLELYTNDFDNANKLVRFVWDDLIKAEQWQVCSELLPEPAQKLDELFTLFDEYAKMREVDDAFNSAKFEQHIVDQLLSNLQHVVTVLRHANRSTAITALERQFYQGLKSRDHATLNKQVHAQGAFLFATH